MALAAALAAEPHLNAEVWHREKFRADTLLGCAAVPLAPLLAAPWVDAPVAVTAQMARAAGSDGGAGEAAAGEEQETVQVSRLALFRALLHRPAFSPLKIYNADFLYCFGVLNFQGWNSRTAGCDELVVALNVCQAAESLLPTVLHIVLIPSILGSLPSKKWTAPAVGCRWARCAWSSVLKTSRQGAQCPAQQRRQQQPARRPAARRRRGNTPPTQRTARRCRMRRFRRRSRWHTPSTAAAATRLDR